MLETKNIFLGFAVISTLLIMLLQFSMMYLSKYKGEDNDEWIHKQINLGSSLQKALALISIISLSISAFIYLLD
jgi:hypothetical protein